MSVRNTPKIQKLVVNAIRKLQDVEGSSPREISNYISQEYDVPTTKIQRQVRLALARAVSYGILQRSKGGYYACNRDFVGCEPQMEEGQPTEKCGCLSGRGHKVKRARSCKSRRRKYAAGSKRRSTRRCAGRSSRRRSRRGKSGRRRGGTSGGGKRSRRRGCRRGRRGAASKKSRRRGRRRARSRRSWRGRRGKKCEPSAGGGALGSNDELELFASRGRSRSASAAKHGNRSVSSGSFEEEEQPDRKRDQAQVIDSPETLLD